MDMKTRNHLSSLCRLYVKQFHLEDYNRLVTLATDNYRFGMRHLALDSVFTKFRQNRPIWEEKTNI